MSLYSYSKNSFSDNPDLFAKDALEVKLEAEKFKNVNIWQTAGNSYSLLERIVNSSKVTTILIPLFFISLGGYFIFKHISPEIKSQIEEKNGLLAQGTTSIVEEDYLDISKYISNPAGLDKVSEEAFSQHILLEDKESINWKGVFYISIPSLGMHRLPVTANVDSTSENAYLTALEDTLAHFKNTGLPISDVENNIVIYGHSATSNYNATANQALAAFTFLPNLKVGDEIIIEIEGKKHKFQMQKSKIVAPNDTTVITGQPGKRTLTLFTCYPPGNDTQRYVAVAREVV